MKKKAAGKAATKEANATGGKKTASTKVMKISQSRTPRSASTQPASKATKDAEKSLRTPRPQDKVEAVGTGQTPVPQVHEGNAEPDFRAKTIAPASTVFAAEPHWPTPTTPDGLHRWLVENLNLRVPQRALIASHTAAFDYLVHSFFEGRLVRAEGGDEPGAWVPTDTPVADCVVWASRGGGKTFLGAVATLLDMIFKPGIEVRVLGGSMEQSRRMHAHLRRLLDPSRHPKLEGLVKGTMTEKRIRFVNGSEVELLAQSQASVRGTRVHKLRCDEVELFNRDVWDAAQLVTRSQTLKREDGSNCDVTGSIECLSTMHVPHGLMRTLVDDAREGKRRLFRWGVVDVLGPCGPEHECTTCVLESDCAGKAKQRDASGEAAGHLSVRDAVAMKGRVSQLTWNAEMLCVSVKRSDCVLPEFDPALHVFSHEIDMPGVTRIAGMDFGFRAPTAILWGVHDMNGDLWIMDERVESGRLLEEHARALLLGTGQRTGHAWPTPEWIGVDPAGRNRNEQTGLSHIQILQHSGLVIRQKRLGVQEGLELVRARLRPAGEGRRPRLFVHVRCVVLRECLEKYHYAADKPYSMDPVKDGYDHAVDALRYLVQNLDKPVRTVRRDWAPM
jgi:hypothetical protein